MKITAKELREKRACEEQVIIFKQEWGETAEVTLPNLLRAVELELDINWFAKQCLTSIKKRYDAEVAPIKKRYDAEVAPMKKQYNAKIMPIWEQCDTTLIPIWERYATELIPIRKQYDTKLVPIKKRYATELALLINRLVEEETKCFVQSHGICSG